MELLGRAKTLEVLANGRPLNVERALELGLCEQRIDTLEGAIEFALEHAIESRRVSRAIKRLVTESGRLTYPAALQLEAQLFAHTWGKEAHLRALDENLKHK